MIGKSVFCRQNSYSTNVIYKSRANEEFAVVYYVYAHWLLNKGNSSKGRFHGTHGTPSRSTTGRAFTNTYYTHTCDRVSTGVDQYG